MSLATRIRASLPKFLHPRFVGLKRLVLALVVASVAVIWIFGQDPRSYIAVPPDPVVTRFVDANFSHEERPESSAKKGAQNISRFTLTVELKNNTNHKITARSADLFDKSGYFLFGCRIIDKPRTVAGNSVAKLRCVADGKMPRARVGRMLRRICEIDLHLSGKGLAARAHPVPWPRAHACVS